MLKYRFVVLFVSFVFLSTVHCGKARKTEGESGQVDKSLDVPKADAEVQKRDTHLDMGEESAYARPKENKDLKGSSLEPKAKLQNGALGPDAKQALHAQTVPTREEQMYLNALAHFKTEAKQGIMHVEIGSSNLYFYGLGTDKNHRQAFDWFSKEAKNNKPSSQYHLGNLYLLGFGIRPDGQKAFYWYQKASKQGHAESQYMRALLEGTGTGVSKNMNKALTWLKLSAGQGYQKAKDLIQKLNQN